MEKQKTGCGIGMYLGLELDFELLPDRPVPLFRKGHLFKKCLSLVKPSYPPTDLVLTECLKVGKGFEDWRAIMREKPEEEPVEVRIYYEERMCKTGVE